MHKICYIKFSTCNQLTLRIEIDKNTTTIQNKSYFEIGLTSPSHAIVSFLAAEAELMIVLALSST